MLFINFRTIGQTSLIVIRSNFVNVNVAHVLFTIFRGKWAKMCMILIKYGPKSRSFLPILAKDHQSLQFLGQNERV